jgi:hypothetical protein
VIVLLVLILGVGAFLWEISGEHSGKAWQAYLINLLFFSAVAQAGPVLAAIYYLTEARWGGRVMSLAMGFAPFLPISFLLFAVLLIGFPYFPAQSAEFPGRGAWFSRSFLIARNTLGLALLYSVSLSFVYQFLNFASSGSSPAGVITPTGNYGTPVNAGLTREIKRRRKLTCLAILVLVLYALVFSLIGFDFVMALERGWYSTLFGAYFFMSSFYVGLLAILVTIVIAKRYLKPKDRVQEKPLWDLGKLVFAFCLLTAYFLWAQYLVIWYGNLPEEVGFIIHRIQNPSWAWLAWIALALIFAVPFLTLLSQRAKQSSPILLAVGVIALIGMWLERYLLVGPSLALDTGPQLGWTEATITVTFLAAMFVSYSVYLRFVLPRWAAGKISVA